MKTGRRGIIDRAVAFVLGKRGPGKHGHPQISAGLPWDRLVQHSLHEVEKGMAGNSTRKHVEISQKETQCNRQRLPEGKKLHWGKLALNHCRGSNRGRRPSWQGPAKGGGCVHCRKRTQEALQPAQSWESMAWGRGRAGKWDRKEGNGVAYSGQPRTVPDPFWIPSLFCLGATAPGPPDLTSTSPSQNTY